MERDGMVIIGPGPAGSTLQQGGGVSERASWRRERASSAGDSRPAYSYTA